MSCCNNGRNCQPQISEFNNGERTYRNSPYPVYPPFPICPNGQNGQNGGQNCRINGVCPDVCPQPQVVTYNNCRRIRDFEDIFKATTLGNEEVLSKGSIPFNYNAFGNKSFVTHYPHDNNFKIEESAMYQVIFKLNFTPSDDGLVSFVLRQNGTPINETLVITEAEKQKYTTITFDDILKLDRETIIDLQFTDNSNISAITVVNPYIIFRQLD